MTKEELLEELAEKKLSEEALRKSEANFRSIFNHSVQFMGILDTNGILLEINKIALQIWGVKKSDVINKPFWEAPWFSNPLELQTKVHKAIEDAAQGNFIHFEIKHIMSDGSYRYIDASLKPVNDADSKVVMLIAEGHDTTERKKVEEEILNIAKGVSSKIGENFLLELTKYIAKTLHADYAYIGETLSDDLNHVQTLALIADGKFIDNIKVNVDGTPCETVLNKGICSCSANVQELFPRAHMMAKMNVESYFGIPLNSSSGECVGLMSVMYLEPITDVKMIEPFLKIFASRACAEIERMKVEDELQKAHDELELRVRERTLELQEKNIALKVLLKQREDDKKELEHNILSNIKSLIQPHIIKLKRNNASSEDIAYLNIVESNLENIISPFSEKLSSNYMRFTSKEIQIANLIKEGKKDKEIMEIMNIAFDTVKAHRKNIRKKLGIHGKGTSLRNKLLSI